MKYHVRLLAGVVDPRAGSHVYHYNLARRLSSRGHKVSLVCFRSEPEIRDLATVVEIPHGDYPNMRFFWRIATLLQYRHFNRELMRLDIPPADVVIGGEHLFLRAHRRKFPQTPLIYLPHAPIAPKEIRRYGWPVTMSWIASGVYDYLQRWGLNNGDRTLRFTRIGCEILKSYYGDSIRPRFVVNPAGFDLPPLQGNKQIGDEVRFLSVGRLVSWKRIDLALSVLAKLRQYRWRFDVVGEGEARESLEQQAQRLGLEDRVRFHGYQQDLSSWYSQADLFLFPSEFEGLGFVVLEAMSHGVPCLARKPDFVNIWNANDEIITHGINGLLANDEEGYLTQLKSVLSHPQQLVTLGLAARERVVENFTWDNHLDRYEELFHEVIHERRHSNGSRQSREVAGSRRVERRKSPIRSARIPSLHHVLVSRELGGAGLIALGLAKSLLDRAEESHVWIPGDGPARTEAEKLELTSHDYSLTNAFSPSKLAASVGNWQFYRACRARRTGIIHVHSPYVYGAIRKGLKLAGIKRVVHVQLDEDSSGLRWAFKQPPELIITCAKYLVNNVRQFIPLQHQQSQRIVAVPNAVDTNRFSPGDKYEAKQRVGASTSVPLILSIANLAHHKGQETVIRAVAELRDQGVDVNCWLAGIERDGAVDYTNRLRLLISEMGVDDRIRLVGFRRDTIDLLRAADLFLLPSEREGLPVAVLEAQACKVPVLAAPTAGIPEVVCHGKTGLLIPALDYLGYSNAIQMLLGSRRLYDEISQNAYEQIIREYDWKTYCDRIWGLYCELVGVDYKNEGAVHFSTTSTKAAEHDHGH